MNTATRIALAACLCVLVAGSSVAQDRNVTFEVDMSPYITTCQHDPMTDDVQVRGNVFGWDDTAPAMDDDGDGTYSLTVALAEGTAVEYKYFSTGGLEYEDQTGNRQYTVSSDPDQTVGEVVFADGDPVDNCDPPPQTDENYEITFTADMSVQVSRGAFDPDTQTVGVAGNLTDWGTCVTALAPDAFEDNVYTGLVIPLDGNNNCEEKTLSVPSDEAYKFVILNSSDNSIVAWESGNDRIYSLTGMEPDGDGDGRLEAEAPRRFWGDVDASQVLQQATTVTFRVDLGSAEFYLRDNPSGIPGTPEVSTAITGVFINGPAMWESTPGGGPGGGITDWLTWGPADLGSRPEFGFEDGDGDGVWELALDYPAGALTTLVGKFGINGNDNEGCFGNDAFFPIGDAAGGTIDLVFGALLKDDGTFRDDCGPGDQPIYDPYILVDNTATPPTAMVVDGTGGADVSIEEGPELPAGISLTAPRPNPTAGMARLDLTLDQGMEVSIEVVDLMGRTVAVVADGYVAAGTTELSLDAGTLAAGTYLLRVQAGTAVTSRRMTVVR